MVPRSNQQTILSFVSHFVSTYHYPPSIREIVSGCGLHSTSVAHHHLKALEKDGLIERAPDVSRGIRVLSQPEAGINSVPILGSIAAGEPLPMPGINPDSHEEETIDIPASLMKGRHKDVFALRVKGDSMIDALVQDGDIVILQHQNEATNGTMVAAWLKMEQATTLKRLYLEGNQVRLQPENQAFEPIYVAARDVLIQGRVIGVVRSIS